MGRRAYLLPRLYQPPVQRPTKKAQPTAHSFHELRHSCASMLIAMGWTLKDVQEWLGHSDIKMTANIYSHLDVARKNNIAASLADKFGAV